MTSSNPPYPYFNGITYNPSFFISSSSSSGSGLTKAQANALYLQKTVADTATVLETFSGGIATNSLNTTTTSSNLLIGATGNTGTITISTVNTGNTNANPAISIGTDAGVKTIKINNNSNSVHCSALDLAGSGINNITNTSGDINVGQLQTTGTLNIGTNTGRTIAGIINIGTGISCSNAVNIATGDTFSGSVNIGNGATTTHSINIGNSTGAGTINIGSATKPINIGGTLTATGLITANNNLALGNLKTITLGTVAGDTAVLNATSTNGLTNTFTATLLGQTIFIYTSAQSANIAQQTNTVIYSTTVSNTGIYNISYCTRFSGSGTTAVVQGAQAWIYVSSPALYGGLTYGQLALTLVGYASPYLNLSTVGLATTASWTGLVNAGATVSIQVYLQYSAGNYTGFVLGGATNYLTLTRIA